MSIGNYLPRAPLPDTEEFTPEQAQAVTRRAIRLHDKDPDAVSIEVVRDSLRSLGVAPDAVERAAAQMRAELKEAPQLRKPSDYILQITGLMALCMPSVLLAVYGYRLPMPEWAVALLSLYLMFLAVRSRVRVFRQWRRSRELQPDIAEITPDPYART